MLLFIGGHALVFRMLSEHVHSAIEEDLRAPFGPIPSAAAAMTMPLRRLRLLAPTREDVLLTGETGTGKEVYARAIHLASNRPGPFVALNCAALPTELVESELFGYSRGAHSQASSAKPGLIEQARGGTLFLDEIGDMPRSSQAKLLRFLQERELLPLGSTHRRKVDVRVIAATAHLITEDQRPTVRPDLAARLGAHPIALPPLRERLEDVGALIEHFLDRRRLPIETRAFLALCLHDWPANIRELEKTIHEAIAVGNGKSQIRLEDLPQPIVGRFSPIVGCPPKTARRSPRPAPAKEELDALLKQHGGRISDVARHLDRRWPVVWRWMKRYGLRAGSSPESRHD